LHGKIFLANLVSAKFIVSTAYKQYTFSGASSIVIQAQGGAVTAGHFEFQSYCMSFVCVAPPLISIEPRGTHPYLVNFHPIVLAFCLMLSASKYAQNFASIIYLVLLLG